MNEQVAFSVTQTTRRLGVSRTFLYLEMERGLIASIKIGKRRLIHVDDANAYLAGRPEVEGKALKRRF